MSDYDKGLHRGAAPGSYLDGIIKKEEFEKRLSGALSDAERYRNSTLRFDEEIGALLPLLEGNIKTTPDFEKLKGVIGGAPRHQDYQEGKFRGERPQGIQETEGLVIFCYI